MIQAAADVQPLAPSRGVALAAVTATAQRRALQLGAALLPLVYWPWTYDSYVLPKLLLARSLVLILLLLFDATRFRRPETWSGARPLVLAGGIALALVSVGHQVVAAIETHNFAVGHDFSNHAVDNALTKGTPFIVIDYLDLIAGLAVAAGMVATALGAMRVGLLPRWMGILGAFSGILIFFPLGGVTLEVVPAFWMVMMAILFAGRWPNGNPPAWAAGEARPWPSQAKTRASRQTRDGKPAPSPAIAQAGAAADVAPAPTRPASGGSSRRRRRKRGARR